MNLRDEIASEVGHGDHLLNVQTADAIIALVRAHLTSDEAKVRAMSAAWKAYETEQGRPPEGADAMFMAVCAAILAALGEGE